MRRFMFTLLLAALLLSWTPGTAVAGYCYNYSFDWSVHPWNIAPPTYVDENLEGAASNAETQQDLAGHTGMAYFSATPSAITANLGAVRHMFLVGHAAPGEVLVSSGSHYSGTTDHAGYVTSNINVTGAYFRLRPTSDYQTVRQTAYVSSVTNSPARVVIYLGCNTGADPAYPYKNFLYATTGQAGADFAGGFTEYVDFTVSNGGLPPNSWGYKYWQSLRLGYNAWYSMENARSYIHSVYNSDCGYDSKWYRGNGNVTM